MKVFFAPLIFVASLLPASAQSVDACKKITTEAERLACFDRLPARPAQAAAPKALPKSSPNDAIAKAKAAILRQLKDPDSAQFRDLLKAPSEKEAHYVCGLVNSKNSYGGYSGFKSFIYTVTPDYAVILDPRGGNPQEIPMALDLFKVFCTSTPLSF